MSELVLRAILHPTDFSESSRPALLLARDLARDHAALLVLVHVADPAGGQGPLGGTAPAAGDVVSRMAEEVARLQGTDPALKVEGRVVEGLPTDTILAAAAQARADLIVMGSHGRTGLGRVLLGSVAERVSRQATCPVLILKASPADAAISAAAAGGASADRPGPRFPVVLVPSDFSTRSREALRVASWLVQEGSRVVVVHVVQAVHVATEGYAEALLERLREWAAPVLGPQLEYRLGEGDPAEEILSVAGQTGASLIIVPSHGRTGLDRILMGSVAEQVFRGAACPVLILQLPTDSSSLAPARA